MQLHPSAVSGRHGQPTPPLSVSEPVWQDDQKFHPRHAPAPSLRQWFNDKVWDVVGRQTVPAYATILLCLVCVWAGASMRFSEELPVPSAEMGVQAHAAKGGMHPVSGSSRSLLLLSNEAEHKKSASGSGSMEAATHKHHGSGAAPTTEELQDVLEHFEHNALNRSGFLDIRPPFPATGESGEPGRMRVIPYQVISWYPRIHYYPSFLTPKQTEHIAKLALARMAPSDLAYRPGESIPESQEVRTSTGCFLRPEDDKEGVLWEVAEKIASITHLPVENGEAFNVLRYLPTQHYDSHMDTFDPKDFGKQPSQRIATFLTFLRAPEEGGETVFKREGEHNANITISDWRGCADHLGIKVKPQIGDAVLFWSVTPDLQLDPRALHGACPVVKGEKISMARWIREKPFGSRRQQRTRKP